MRFVIVFVGSILLVACVVPLRMTVYEPACNGGTGLSCMQRDDKLIIELPGGAKINVDAHLLGVSQKANKTISMCIDLQLERESTFRFVSTKITFKSSAWNAPKTVNIKEFTEPGPKFYPADSTITGRVDMTQDTSKPLNTRYIAVWIESAKGTLCETNIPAVAEFTLHLPDVLVNNQKIQIPPVNFMTKKKWVVEGLCC